MSDGDNATHDHDAANGSGTASVPSSISADYKILGYNQASTGTTYGVMGKVDSAGGYGLYTPNDAKVDGDTVTPVLQSGAGTSLTLNTDGGSRALELGVPRTDSAGDTAGGNVVAGHPNNTVTNSAVGVVVGGGGNDLADGANSAGDDYATVGGGIGNTANGQQATIGGGAVNTVSGTRATVSGGFGNDTYAEGSSIGGGVANRTGTSGTAKGFSATVPGGIHNLAREDYSFAAGRRAKAKAEGAFVWGDSTDSDVASTVPDEFKVRASGGAGIYTSGDLSTGVTVGAGGGSWSSVSSESVKTAIDPVEPGAVLDGVERLSISTWEYDSDEDATHMGPMAEDFHEEFGLGADERRITGVDADGVALAAIQGLSRQLAETNAQLETLKAETEALREHNDELEERLGALVDHLGPDVNGARSTAADD